MVKFNPQNTRKNTLKKGKQPKYRTTMKRTKPKNKSINHTLKHIKKTQRTMELDDSPEGIVESLRITTTFVRRILDRMENQNVNENAKANTSIFLSFLASKLYSVAKNHVALLTEEEEENETKSNVSELYNESRLLEDTNEYVSDFFDMIESEELAANFIRVADEYHEKLVNNTLNTMNMRKITVNIAELEEEYTQYANFLQDTNRAVWDTIREYDSYVLKSNNKRVATVDDIIHGLSAMRVTSSSVVTNNNINKLSRQMSSMTILKKSNSNIEDIADLMIKKLKL